MDLGSASASDPMPVYPYLCRGSCNNGEKEEDGERERRVQVLRDEGVIKDRECVE